MLLEKKLNYYEIFNENQIFLNFNKKAMSPGAIFLTPLLMGQWQYNYIVTENI